MIELVQARSEDCRRVFDLSNDPHVRAVSLQSAAIPWSDHESWYAKQMSDPDRLFFLGFEVGKNDEASFIGQIRFKKLDSSAAEVSISLSPVFRGRGYGRHLFALALSAMREKTSLTTVVAKIKPDNEMSMKFFAALGFLKDPSQGLIWKLELR